ncbi:hypothetical protein GGE65_008451 [Skermanella aerolata]|uniref:hypothetical protein n=1 Tax=Skermanella aerolata TaxID=393310 RepID=UPI003D203B8F
MLPIRFYAVAAIALAPILDHFGAMPHWQAWVILLAGVLYIAFRLGVVLEDRLHDLEHRARPHRGGEGARAMTRK